MNLNEIFITASPFFGEKLHMKMSPKLNCIMGGRGSGKTTLLTLINWIFSEDSELSRESLSLIKTNLGSATFTLIVSDTNGNSYEMTRNYGSPVLIKGKTGSVVGLQEFKKKLNLNYYASGSIEKIGIDPKERLKILDNFIGDEVEVIKGQISILIGSLKQNEIEIKSANSTARKQQEELNNFENIEEEMNKAKAELLAAEADAELKEKFEKENVLQAKRSFEKKQLDETKDIVIEAEIDLQNFVSSVESVKSFLNDNEDSGVIAKKIKQETFLKFEKITELINSIKEIISPVSDAFDVALKDLSAEHLKAEASFSELKQAIAKHRDVFQKINILSQKQTAKKIADESLSKCKEKVILLEKTRKDLLKKIAEKTSERSEVRSNNANKINELLGGKVKILIKNSSLNDNFQEILREVLSKGQMRFTNTETRIIENSTPDELVRFYNEKEFKKYALKLSVDQDRIESIFKVIADNNFIYDIESCICEDSPNFFLAVEDKETVESFKPTEELSTGQRCTAVLPIIFALTENPLLIDQPEDNLDNKYIAKSIHQIIRSIKEKRQLIFVTHNPNIPVIADAEFCAFLSFNDQHSEVVAQGAIEAVKTQIVDLLEGGTVAFVTRKEFYGY